ncbi:peptidylprolyl isomerase [Flavobacteriales bacterium]|nr:peptidylprolyl isomerase [Flavobacteriales bacterium]
MKKLIIASSILLFLFACKKDNDLFKVSTLHNKEQIIEIKTQFGDMYIWLYDATPLHKENFLKLASEDYYDSTTFHRVISGFMAQGGDPNSKDADPTNDGSGGPGYTVPAEIRDSINHERGALAAARTNNPAKASSGSQFYICHSTSGTAGLDGNYTVYGMVMQGIEVVDSLVIQPKDASNNRPLTDIVMDVNVLNKTLEEISSEYGYVPRY